MKFSIIVPIYNVSQFLKECIESIITQTNQDFELILVNDGSKDNSLDICNAYAKGNNKIIVVDKQNGGLTSARKAGARIAKGDYIICVDGDDTINNRYLEICNRIIDKYSPDCICFEFNRFSENGKFVTYRQHYENAFFTSQECKNITNKFIYDTSLKTYNDGDLSISIWSKVVKSSLYKSAQMCIDNSVSKGEDLLLSAYIYSKCNSIYFSNYVSYNYRYNSDSITHKFSKSFFEQNLVIFKSLSSIYGKQNPKVKAYLFSACLGNFDIAIKVLNFKDYKINFENFANEYNEIYETVCDWKVKKMPLTLRIRQFFIKKQSYGLYYIVFKLLKKN